MANERKPLALNVNDSAPARYLVSRILKNMDIDVVEAGTGAEALAAVAKHRPDLVILDIRLPDMDGYEVCRAIKRDPSTASIAVLQTSATFVTGEGKARGLDSGAEAYLPQPFESIELAAMVRSLLRLRRSEQDAQERAHALATADRRKDEFLAMLAHELRNPLSAILVATNLLEQPDLEPHRVARFAATIARQARHLGRLVDDLLDVSRITRDRIQLARQPLDLMAAIRDIVAALLPAVEQRNHRLTTELPDHPVIVDADPTRIEQIVSNLLSNALKYTEAGGRISMTLAEVERPEGTRARFTIADTGVGISKDNIASIWDLFYQVDTSLARTQSGLGVGLTLVRRLIEMHGGKVGVKSDGVGLGSEFWFELPIVQGDAAAKDEGSAAENPQHVLRILLVDDNADACDLCQIVFERKGHFVETAYDGQEGIAKALAGEYDVAVIDIGLPIVNGYQVAERLRAELGDKCPVLIALTGYGRPEDKKRALDAGFTHHLSKPMDVDQVLRLFNRVSKPDEAEARAGS